mmetsp:Transcript_74028/g.217219  ORF Transcript_74028/g.217219 Transcript_74028/m.217219 type:complete len:351 (-) Transcript_74028:291-1343(-)
MVKGFNSPLQAICTAWCLLALGLAAISTILIHVAFKTLLDPLVDLPANLEEGINDVLGFATLEPDVLSVKAQAEAALAKCNVPPSTCPNPSSVPTSSSDTTAELTAIGNIFNSTLTIIKRVATDRYLGIEDFAALAGDLEVMQANLTQLQNQPQPLPCSATNEMFCSVRSAAADIAAGVSTVTQGVDEITGNEAITEFENMSAKFSWTVNLLPYIFWVCALFYLVFFMTSRPSCRGGRIACCSCTFHGIFFFLSLLISISIVAAGIAIVIVAADWRVPEPFRGQPTIADLVDHLQTNFPEFYRVVLEDLIDGLKKTFNAYVVFLAAHIMLLINACTCCCGLYSSQEKASN